MSDSRAFQTIRKVSETKANFPERYFRVTLHTPAAMLEDLVGKADAEWIIKCVVQEVEHYNTMKNQFGRSPHYPGRSKQPEQRRHIIDEILEAANASTGAVRAEACRRGISATNECLPDYSRNPPCRRACCERVPQNHTCYGRVWVLREQTSSID